MAAKPRILLVNGNSSEAVTDRLAAFAREAAPQFDFRPYTPAGGPPYVSTPDDVALAAAKVVETMDLAVRDGAPDGCIIACFGEPGLPEARRRYDFPVVGMAEASMLTAMQLGERFAIVTLGEHWPAMLGDLVRLYGVEDRCAGIARIPGTPFELMADPGWAATAVAAAAKETGAEVVIIGGAALVGVASAIRPMPGLRLIDCLQAGIAQMAALIEYRRMATALTSSI